MTLPNPKRPKKIRLLSLVLLIIVASVGGVYAYQQLNPAQSCAAPLGNAKILKTQLAAPATFGGVSEFALPSPDREANAPTVAPDGSVWFAEQSVAGIAHFYPGNRTLVEYAWPYAYPEAASSGALCGDKTFVWGLALWNGKVWAGDTVDNQLVALDPSTGQFATVKVQTNGSFPYTLTPGPDNKLWFTELFVQKIGELSSNGTLREHLVPGGVSAEPSQVIFANSTTGYYVDTHGGDAKGGVYSFDPAHFAPKLVGGQNLNLPSSIAISSGAIWVTLHGSSSLASYNFTTRTWAYYPTTAIGWYPTTLPYFVSADGSYVWFNEHYGNKMAKIDPAKGSLTEYSESSSQSLNGSTIGNALTFAVGGGRAWFTELTGNILGYVDASYAPGFSTSIAGNNTVVISRGSNASVSLVVHDTTHQGMLSLSFADSESLTSKPSDLTFSAPGNSVSPPMGGVSSVKVTVSASQSLKPGIYFAILTATDGLTYESSFMKIVVRG